MDAPAKKLILATANPDKVAELNRLLKDGGWHVLSLKEAAGEQKIEENGKTLEENAEIKARFVYEMTGIAALADDTGLEVDALGGRPGVYSARFGGPEENALLNRAKLLDEMRMFPKREKRTARFRTVLIYIDQKGVRRYDGVCEGHILLEERGTGGFGYDPLFQPKGHKITFAEMDPVTKNRISHRGLALNKFLADMQKLDASG